MRKSPRSGEVSRYRRFAFACVVAGLVLAGCGGGSEGGEEPALEDGVRLSVPPESGSGAVTVVVEHVGLKAGTEIALYAYRMGWGDTRPTCQGSVDQAGSLTVEGDAREGIDVSLLEGPGRYWWVLTAPGYTSECGASGTLTRVLSEPYLSLGNSEGGDLDDEDTPLGKAGEPYELSVDVDTTPPEGEQWSINVKWYGPYENTPEAVEAGCSEAAAVSQTLEADTAGSQDVEVTPPAPGVYRVVAEQPRTAYSIAVDTGCDEETPLVVVE